MRCFTCGKEVANLWTIYCQIQEQYRDGSITSEERFKLLNKQTGLKRICCKRMLLTHVEIIDKLTQYSTLVENEK